MHDVQIGRYQRQVSERWNELSRRQLLRVVRELHRPLAAGQDVRLALLQILFRVPRRVLRQLNAVQLLELRPLTDFLADTRRYAPLTTQLLPVLRAPWRLTRYHGPAERFRNLSFAEFIDADTFFLLYLKKQEAAALDSLLAVLYRPQRADYDPAAPDYTGDIRQDYNPHLLAARAARLAGLSPATKLAVLLWYTGCRRDLERRYPRVFDGDNEETASTSGWQDVLLNLSDGVHRVTATAAQPLHTVMREMQRVLLAHDRQLEAYQAR